MQSLLKIIVFVGLSSSFVCSMEEIIDPTRLRGAALVKYKSDLKEQEKAARKAASGERQRIAKDKAEQEEAEALRLRTIDREREAAARAQREQEAAEERRRQWQAERERAEKLALERQSKVSSDAAFATKQLSKAEKRRLKQLAEIETRKKDEERRAAAIAIKESKKKAAQASLSRRSEGANHRTLAIDYWGRLDPELQLPLSALNPDAISAVNDVLLNIDFEIAKQWPHRESLIEYLRLRQDLPQGVYQMGRCHEEGFAFPEKDIAAAEDCFRRAASAGHEKAEERLQMLREKATSLRVGDAVSSGEQNITCEMLQCAIAGDEDAYFQIGFCCEMGYGIVQSFSEAARWYHFAAEKKHTDAENRLAWFYKKGFGVQRDDIRSAYFYKKVAKKGDRSAQCNFAMACASGDGVPRNMNKAMIYYARSAAQKYPPAQFHFGCYLYLGVEVAQDTEKGLCLIRAAADQGMPDAQDALRQIESGATLIASFISRT